MPSTRSHRRDSSRLGTAANAIAVRAVAAALRPIIIASEFFRTGGGGRASLNPRSGDWVLEDIRGSALGRDRRSGAPCRRRRGGTHDRLLCTDRWTGGEGWHRYRGIRQGTPLRRSPVARDGGRGCEIALPPGNDEACAFILGLFSLVAAEGPFTVGAARCLHACIRWHALGVVHRYFYVCLAKVHCSPR